MFNMQCRKIIPVIPVIQDNQKKKRMNISNFINIYTNLYAYIIYDKNDSK